MTRKFHKFLHIQEWIMFGSHLDFAVREPKSVVSTKKMKVTMLGEKPT